MNCWLGKLDPASHPDITWLAAIPGVGHAARRPVLATILAGAVTALALDINLTGPHRLYRDALADTFIRSKHAPSSARPLDHVNKSGRAPYHLINATVNLPAEETPQLRDRKCGFLSVLEEFLRLARDWLYATKTGGSAERPSTSPPPWRFPAPRWRPTWA